MRTVEERVKSLCSTEEFLSGTTSQKSELVSGLLSELSNEGLIKSDSIYYDEEGKMYTFQYPCGVLSGIQLENTLYDVDAVGGNTAKVAAVETVASGNNATEISGTSETATKRALVLESFENTPFRTDFYQNMEEEWDGMNLDTTVDYDVTLYDLCGIMKYDYDVIVHRLLKFLIWFWIQKQQRMQIVIIHMRLPEVWLPRYGVLTDIIIGLLLTFSLTDTAETILTIHLFTYNAVWALAVTADLPVRIMLWHKLLQNVVQRSLWVITTV